MFRSGTSCLSTCLTKLGVFLGSDERFFPADEFNPGGYFELAALIDANNRLLDALGNSSVQIRPLPEAWMDLPGITRFVDGIEKILAGEFEGHERWGWKSPQTSVLLPVYRAVFDRLELEPVYPIAVRFPLDVAQSQRSNFAMPVTAQRIVGLWLHYTLSALVETIGKRRAVVKYEALLHDPAGQIKPVVSLVDGWEPSESEWKEVIESVRPDWRHIAHDDAALDDWPPLVRETEFLCRELCRDASGLNDGAYDADIRRLWNAWIRMNAISMLKPLAYARGKTIAVWKENGKDVRYEASFTPIEGWQTVSIPVRIDTANRVGLDLYQTPSRIWIRRAEWVDDKGRRPAQMIATTNGRLVQSEGMLQLQVIGPFPLETPIPRQISEARLELDLLIETDQKATTDIIGNLRDELRQAHAALANARAPRR